MKEIDDENRAETVRPSIDVSSIYNNLTAMVEVIDEHVVTRERTSLP